jgi:hypothetical protein
MMTAIVVMCVMAPADTQTQKAQQAARITWRRRKSRESDREGNEHQKSAAHGHSSGFYYVVTNILRPNRFRAKCARHRIVANLSIDTKLESSYRSAAKNSRRAGCAGRKHF